MLLLLCQFEAVARRETLEHKKELPAATMKDVAEQAGVSTATVSRALMNPEKVSAATRQKVDQAVMAVGYSPHALSRNLKRNESRTILVIVPDICDPFFADLIQGIERTAAESGYLVLIGDCAQQNQQEKTFINLIITKQIDGMLLLGSDLPFDASKEEQRNLPPMVMANEFAPELELPTVHIDNLTAAFEAVHYLLKLGHQRIACIAGPKHMPLCQYRSQGYVQALRRNGLSVESQLTVHGDFSYESGAQAVTELMALPVPPTAIFCHNDVMAVGAMFQAKKMGLRIPQDIAVIGFDGTELGHLTFPPLSTIEQPSQEIGRQAVLLLLNNINDAESQAQHTTLAWRYLSRGSA